ncbi:MAG: hypothetical protein ACRD3P_17680 [Terriglobales bacterium]
MSTIAAEFGISADSIQRHKRHLAREDAKPQENRTATVLLKALRAAEELLDSTTRLGDHRGMSDALTKITSITQSLERYEAKSSGAFESLSLDEQVTYIRTHNDGEIARAYWNWVVNGEDRVLRLDSDLPGRSVQ